MAKKSPANSKAAKEAKEAATAPKPEAPVEEPKTPAPVKPAPKQSEDQADTGIGVADIKKAVSFANSVGGLEKAISLLQILKVAKDVQ